MPLLGTCGHPAGQGMAQRFLIDGALASKYAELSGGQYHPKAEFKNAGHNAAALATKKKNSSVHLLDENLKFGSMPTHPLGTKKNIS